MKYQKELDLLKSVVKDIYDKTILTVKDVSFKGKQDIVTSTDLYIERHLIEAIKDMFPNDAFHSEEYHSKTLLKNRMWLIDPIDGTSNYAANLGLYVVQIALYDQDDIVLSYIYAPQFDKTYYAIKGEGAYLNDQRYHVNDLKAASTFMMSMVGLSHQAKDKTYFKKLIDLSMKKQYKLRMLGSIGLELALTSEGVFNLFYTNVTNLWDICPGVLLLKEAGFILLNDKNEPYQLQDEHLFVCKDLLSRDELEKEIF